MKIWHFRTWSVQLKKRYRLWLLLAAVAFILMLHFILKWENSNSGHQARKSFRNLNIDIPKDFSPVRIIHRETLPSSGDTKIPHIIHQTWKNREIPQEFIFWVKSWLKHHPDWQYWLWTDQSAENLIAERHPHLLATYRGYQEPIRRADALRYVVLYEFGGVYADMDMEAYSSLEPLTLKYSCFIGQEPFEHPIMDTNFEQLLINALIGCRAKHPFMKMLMDSLPDFYHMWSYLDSTGPHFVTTVYKKFKAEFDVPAPHDNALYVTPSEYFYPNMDPVKVSYMVGRCQKRAKLSKLQLFACRNLKFKSLPENEFDPNSIAFANHHWYHTYLKWLPLIPWSTKTVSVYDICPKVFIYTSGKNIAR